jgi:hypothetical protein
VPQISAFYGIVVAMYFADHPPPHFHVRYGEFQAQIEIASGAVISGTLPARVTTSCANGVLSTNRSSKQIGLSQRQNNLWLALKHCHESAIRDPKHRVPR